MSSSSDSKETSPEEENSGTSGSSNSIYTTSIATTHHIITAPETDTTFGGYSPSTYESEVGTTHSGSQITYPSTPVQHTDPPYKPPPIPQPNPHPPVYPTIRTKPKGGRINSEAEERTAMIIGIIAGALIAVILVILLVLWFKSNGDQNYKTAQDKGHNYGQSPNAALLGPSSRGSDAHHHSANSATMPLNGSLRNGHDKSNNGNCGPGMAPQRPKKRDSKDIKEWYV